MKIDAVDEAIIAAFQEDGRQSNREVARKLEVSEGSIRQRLKKLQDGGAVRFDVVTDYAKMGVDFVALIRVSVEPRHLQEFLTSAGQLPELWYLAAVVGRFNIIALIATSSAAVAMHTINSQVEQLDGVNEIEVRPMVGGAKHDFYEIVFPKEK